MNRLYSAGLCPLLLALAPALAAAAAADAPQDVAGQWRDFLATAEAGPVYEAYGKAIIDMPIQDLPTAEACRERGDALAHAVKVVPVSIAVNYLAFQCAQVLGEDAQAEQHMARLGALARHALSSGSDDWSAAPIRVVAGRDIYALLAASGLELQSEVLSPVPQRRHLTYRVVAWDPKAKQERHLYFDFVDTVTRLARADAAAAYPSYRIDYTNSTIDNLARQNSTGALDLKLTREASQLDDPRQVVAALRPMAERGGYQAAYRWFWQCQATPFAGCGEGLVDAVLPLAEKKQVLPTLLLALAYGTGIGVEKDEEAAMALVDAAEARWGGDRAIVQYARMYRDMDIGPMPAEVARRLKALSAEGKPLAAVMLAYDALDAKGAKGLPPALEPALEAAAKNGSVSAMRVLGIELSNARQHERALPWLRMAAEGGDAPSQDVYGSALFFGQGTEPDLEQGRRWWREAGLGGDIDGMRRMAWQAELREAWTEAAEWYRSAAMLGDEKSLLDLAELFEYEFEGLEGGAARAMKIYESMQQGGSQAEARRRMSLLYLEGKGTAKDPARARQLLEQDAARDDRISQVRLGLSLLEGFFGEPEPAQGKAWLDKAMAAGDGEAFDGYATHLYYRDATPDARREAMRLWRQSVDAPGDWGLNNMAWVMCVTPMAELRDPAEGLALAKRMGDADDLPASKLDTLAACHAAAGEFDAAVTVQQAAVAWLEKFAPKDDSMAEMVERVALYKDRKTYTEPDQEKKDEAKGEADADVDADVEAAAPADKGKATD